MSMGWLVDGSMSVGDGKDARGSSMGMRFQAEVLIGSWLSHGLGLASVLRLRFLEDRPAF